MEAYIHKVGTYRYGRTYFEVVAAATAVEVVLFFLRLLLYNKNNRDSKINTQHTKQASKGVSQCQYTTHVMYIPSKQLLSIRVAPVKLLHLLPVYMHVVFIRLLVLALEGNQH